MKPIFQLFACVFLIAWPGTPQATPQTNSQTPGQQTTAINSSISGTVKDKGTGTPLPNFQVSTNASTPGVSGPARRITAVTDQNGHFILNDVPPGTHTVGAGSGAGTGTGPQGNASRLVTLTGSDLSGIDLRVVAFGTIAGKIVDENKDPVPGMSVYLVSREYYLGSLGYYLKGLSRTNSKGEYSLSRVEPGQTFYVLAEPRHASLPVHSDAPLDPLLRKRAVMRTWYPNSPTKEGAQPVVLRAGEQRDGVDLEVKKSPAYCIGGVLSASGRPASLTFSLEALEPSGGFSNGGGLGLISQKATTGPDGEFRICDLSPGPYSLTVREAGTVLVCGMAISASVAVVPLAIVDQDLPDLRIPTSPLIPLEAEVVLDGPAPQTPITAQVNLNAGPLHDSSQIGEGLSGRVDIPGRISAASGLRMDDYRAQASVTGPGLYIKDIAYSGRSVQYEPLRLGNAMAGSTLRVTVGQDGATFSALVADKDGNPVADTMVLSMPADVASEGELAARILRGGTDQNGQYTSGTLAPGKYYVAATDDPLDYTPETIGKLWQSHAGYQEIELAPNGSAQVTLRPVSIR